MTANYDSLEFLNLYSALIDLPALLMIGLYLSRRTERWDWHTTSSASLAVALLAYIGGHGITRGWTWLWRFQQTMGWDISWMDRVPVLAFSLPLSTFGLICLVRVLVGTFSNWLWVSVVILAAVIAAATTWGI